jgi:hypothetical protein
MQLKIKNPALVYESRILVKKTIDILFRIDPCELMPDRFERSLFMILHPPVAENSLHNCQS